MERAALWSSAWRGQLVVREGAQVAPSGPPPGETEQEPAGPNLLPCPEPEADPRAKGDRIAATPDRGSHGADENYTSETPVTL
ncbi:unnamed protein product [Boreogadus saida]